MYVCSWALRHPLVNTNVLVSVLASYAVSLDLTPLAAGKYTGKYVERGNETLRTKNENNGAPISNGERTMTHPRNGFLKVEMTKRYGDHDNQYGGNRSRRLNIHRDDKNQNDEEGQKHNFSS